MKKQKLLFISDCPLGTPNGHGNMVKMHHLLLGNLFPQKMIECYANCEEEKTQGQVYFFKKSSKVDSLIQIVKGYPPYISQSMEKTVLKLIEENEIEFVFIENSFSGKLLQKIRKKNKDIFIVSYFADVECDVMKKQIHDARLRRKLSLLVMINNEKLTVDISDCCIVLNERDSKLFERYYRKTPEASIPIIVPSNEFTLPETMHKSNDKLKLLFVGIDYFPNIHGIDWFVQSVVPNIEVDFVLEVVGYNMEKYRSRWIDKKGRIKVIGSVDSLREYYEDADVVIAPIFEGGGMKVKTAEALSYGKRIIGTEESLLGYWESAGDLRDRFVFRCDDPGMFARVINELQQTNFKKNEKAIVSWMENTYSVSSNLKRMKEIFVKSGKASL